MFHVKLFLSLLVGVVGGLFPRLAHAAYTSDLGVVFDSIDLAAIKTDIGVFAGAATAIFLVIASIKLGHRMLSAVLSGR